MENLLQWRVRNFYSMCYCHVLPLKNLRLSWLCFRTTFIGFGAFFTRIEHLQGYLPV